MRKSYLKKKLLGGVKASLKCQKLLVLRRRHRRCTDRTTKVTLTKTSSNNLSSCTLTNKILRFIEKKAGGNKKETFFPFLFRNRNKNFNLTHLQTV